MPGLWVDLMTERIISFSEFKRKTHHARMKYFWHSKDGKRIKEFAANKFYCNPYGAGENAMLSMPLFNLSKKAEWREIGENQWTHLSEFGLTVFEKMTENINDQRWER